MKRYGPLLFCLLVLALPLLARWFGLLDVPLWLAALPASILAGSVMLTVFLFFALLAYLCAPEFWRSFKEGWREGPDKKE